MLEAGCTFILMPIFQIISREISQVGKSQELSYTKKMEIKKVTEDVIELRGDSYCGDGL